MKKLSLLFLGIMTAAQAITLVPPGSWVNYEITGTSGDKATGTNVASAYWNRDSTDNPNGCFNVGCYIANTGSWPSVANNNSPSFNEGVYLANADGSAILDFGFSASTSGPKPITLLFERSGLSTKNWLGWYKTDYDTSNFVGSHHGDEWGIIFDGQDSSLLSSTVTITLQPGEAFGFWFAPDFDTNILGVNANVTANGISNNEANAVATRLNTTTRGVLFTESSENRGVQNYSDTSGCPNCSPKNSAYSKNNQYFAMFARSSSSSTFYLGAEDLALGDLGQGGDYNDMLWKITVVPEPGFYGALSLGLAGLYLAVRRRKA